MSTDGREEFSAGGVVVRDRECAVIVPVKRDATGRRVLGLPKGHPEPGESAEQAALREVREEAGVTGEIVASLGEVEYEYSRRRRGGQAGVSKRVAFFLIEYRTGDVADHDHEIEEARWMPLDEAATQLTYRGERAVVARAASLVEPRA